jgi:tRNA U34 2-thiouridine synthase MnmA/TrmU
MTSDEFISKNFNKIKQSINLTSHYSFWTYQDVKDFENVCTNLGISVEIVDGIIQ